MHADLKAMISKPIMPRILCGVLVLLILIDVVLGLHSLFSSAHTLDASGAPQVTSSVEHDAVPVARETMLKVPLFGDYMPEDLAGVDVKNSTLHIKLVGVILSPNENESEVILELQDEQQKVFRTGDAVPGGAVIKRINQDEVYMMRNGAIEYLFLPEKGLNFDAPAPPLNFKE